ncbi:MAG: cobalt ECF transporter T component CbiQ [Oscillospiraceae bacterium]|jgi:cobalt/nickel transport system permease protein|nr:cobalt ECF transporter T component CbiQ [Oscillospiraceae bacterium]
MSSITAKAGELRALETLSGKNTAIHRLAPGVKIAATLAFIVVCASFGRYEFFRLVPYLFFPFIMMALAELPYRLLLTRTLIALPFCLFAGLANVFYDRAAAFSVYGIAVSFGTLSLLTILLKTYLCVMAALLLAATTPFVEITASLRRAHLPTAFVMIFETTYRYTGVLLEEVHSMTTAYRLRSGTKKALDMRHMGSFLGQLVLRGFDRAERVHAAQRCRGYSLRRIPPPRRKLRLSDAAYLAAVCIPAALLRFVALY